MAQPRRTLLRVVLVLLAAAPVIAAAWMTTTPYDPERELAAQEEAAKSLTPMPGSEAALRRTIAEIQRGQGRLAKQQRDVVALGPLLSLTHLDGGETGLIPGMGTRFDIYATKFRNGIWEWMLTMEGGAPVVMGMRPYARPTWQEWIRNYAALPMRERATRTLTQLGILLAAALFARWALRVRL